MVEALGGGNGVAVGADDGGGEGLDLSATGGGDGLVECGVAQGEELGTVVDAAVVPAFGGAAPAETTGFFEEDRVESCGAKGAGGGDAGESGADDGDALSGHGRRRVRGQERNVWWQDEVRLFGGAKRTGEDDGRI